jgi:exoribonuclease R
MRLDPAHAALDFQVLQQYAMLPMPLAQYIAAGDGGSQSWRHYALSIPYYTHFTSPIRRYADVVVHRLLQVLAIAGMRVYIAVLF